MFIKWKKSYETGNPIIDMQHKGLVDIINELHAAIKERGDIDYAYITYNELIKYTKIHFLREESLLINCNYKDLDKHKELHKKLTQRVHKLEEEFSKNRKDICIETILFLKSWLIDHIIAEDLKYVRAIKNIKDLT